MKLIDKILSSAAAIITRIICGTVIIWNKSILDPTIPKIYFANHTSNLDFLVIWASIPSRFRKTVRPVAAQNYWEKTPLRLFVSQKLFRSILIDRLGQTRTTNPLEPVYQALAQGDSIIIFPEGTRSQDGSIKPFKSGLFHLSRKFPQAELIPIYLKNLNRMLPKGEILFVPLLSAAIFGTPLEKITDESKTAFLQRAQSKLMELAQ